jgi:hypothetical protein
MLCNTFAVREVRLLVVWCGLVWFVVACCGFLVVSCGLLWSRTDASRTVTLQGSDREASGAPAQQLACGKVAQLLLSLVQ